MQSICVTNHKLIISAFWLQIYDYYFIFQNFLLFFCQFTNKKGQKMECSRFIFRTFAASRRKW